MRIRCLLRTVTLPVALTAALAPANARAAALFTATVGGSTDQDPIAAAATGGFTDSFSTGTWNGSAVADGHGGAGAQLVLSAGNTGTYRFVCGQNACTVVSATASTSDVIRITPTALAPGGTPVDLRFDITLDGSVVGNGGWSISAGGNAGIGTGVGYANGTGGTVGAHNLVVHEVMSFMRTMVVGTDYSLTTNLSIGALLRGIGPEPYGIDVDFLHSLTIQGFVLSPGVGPLELIGDSGRDYLAAAVPAPAASWLVLAGLGSIAALRRRAARALLSS